MSSFKKENRVLKAGFGYTIGNFLLKGLTFLTIPIFVRLLSSEDYGAFNIFIAYESIMYSVVGLTLQMSIKNAKYKFIGGYNEYLSSLLLLELFLLIIWLFIAFLLNDQFYCIIGFSKFLSLLLLIHCFCSTILVAYNIHLSLSYSFKSFLIISGLNAILNIFVSIILINTLFYDNRYLGRVLGTIIPLILISLYIYINIWTKSSPKINFNYWKFACVYSIPLIPHAISQVVLNQFDRIMISNLIGLSSAGIYSFAYNVCAIIDVTRISLDNTWSPWFYEHYAKHDYNIIKNRSSLYALGMLVFTLIVVTISPELVNLLGTKEYESAVYSVIPICAGGYFVFLYTLPAQIEYFKEKTKYIALGTVCAACINIILNYLFIPRFGYIAAAYTTEVTYILYFVFHYIISKRLDKNKIFITNHLFIMALICILYSLVCIFLVDFIIIRYLLALLIICLIFKKIKNDSLVIKIKQEIYEKFRSNY